MAMVFKSDEAVGCSFVRWTGTVTAEAFQSNDRTVFTEPWFRKGLSVIHDGRQAGCPERLARFMIRGRVL